MKAGCNGTGARSWSLPSVLQAIVGIKRAAGLFAQLVLQIAVRLKSSDDGDDVGLTTGESSAYRMLAARLDNIAQDNPYEQLSAKEACRCMSSPGGQEFANDKSW